MSRISLSLFFTLIVFTSCSVQKSRLHLESGGASLPYPLYNHWFQLFYEKTHHQVNYLSVGSGAGQDQFLNNKYDFFGTEDIASISNKQSPSNQYLFVPTAVGAVVIAYNLPGVERLSLSEETIIGLFTGTIRSWSDSRILVDNGEYARELRGDITPVVRKDESGTSKIFSRYLASIDTAFKEKHGASVKVDWPLIGQIQAKRNEGVANVIERTPGSIGYLSFSYAKQSELSFATIQNPYQYWVRPNLQSLNNNDTDRENHQRSYYPIKGLTYLVAHRDLSKTRSKREEARIIKKLFEFVLQNDVQALNVDYYFAPIPQALRKDTLRKIKNFHFEGESL